MMMKNNSKHDSLQFLRMWAVAELGGLALACFGLFFEVPSLIGAAGGMLTMQVAFSSLVGAARLWPVGLVAGLLVGSAIMLHEPWYYGYVLALALFACLPALQNLAILIMPSARLRQRLRRQ